MRAVALDEVGVVERSRAWTRLFWMSVAALDEVVVEERRCAWTKSAGL
jgi:hypothetical protein